MYQARRVRATGGRTPIVLLSGRGAATAATSVVLVMDLILPGETVAALTVRWYTTPR